MKMYGKNYATQELRQRIGNMDQVAGVRTVQLQDGPEHPGRAAVIHTGSGLELTVLLDRCLDISAASFQGRPMAWRSTTGDIAPQYYEPEGLRWLRGYFGGMVTTCGLINVGAPADDSPVSGNGLHGRIGNAPARNVQVRQAWDGDDYVLSVTGSMRETRVFGENLLLTRTVSTKLGAKRFQICDTLTNEGFDETQFQLLYHCNVGWPAVDEGSQVLAPVQTIAPRDADAADGKEAWAHCDAPIHGYAEKVYYHDMAPAADGSVTCAVVNNGFDAGEGFGVYLKYYKSELPRFAHWKQMGEQEYVIGLEPCNCCVEGKAVDEKYGLVDAIAPGESRTFRLEFGAVTTPDELAALRKTAAGPGAPTFAKHFSEFVKKPR